MSLFIAGGNQHRHDISRIALLALVTCNNLLQSRSDKCDCSTDTASIANTRDIEWKLRKGNAKGIIHGLGHHGHCITQGMLCSTQVYAEESASLDDECQVIHLACNVDDLTDLPAIENLRRHLAHGLLIRCNTFAMHGGQNQPA